MEQGALFNVAYQATNYLIRRDNMKNKIEALYLDWFNNFLTVERFAEYYGMPVDKAHKVIRIGRYLNHRRG
mgnify:CR=1 FL=1